MGILKEATADRVRSRVYGKLRDRRVLATAGLALAAAFVAAIALTGDPGPAHACLFPGIPC